MASVALHLVLRMYPAQVFSTCAAATFEMSRHTTVETRSAILMTNSPLPQPLTDLRETLESRARCRLVKHHLHVEVRWVERVLVRRRGATPSRHRLVIVVKLVVYLRHPVNTEGPCPRSTPRCQSRERLRCNAIGTRYTIKDVQRGKSSRPIFPDT